MAKNLKAGAKFSGPMAFSNDEAVGHVPGFYALESDGKTLLKQNGKPVRLVQIDLAPGNPDDGSQEFRVAAKGDPPQKIDESKLVTLEPEQAQGTGDLGLGGRG